MSALSSTWRWYMDALEGVALLTGAWLILAS
jgi:hypothetical protein